MPMEVFISRGKANDAQGSGVGDAHTAYTWGPTKRLPDVVRLMDDGLPVRKYKRMAKSVVCPTGDNRRDRVLMERSGRVAFPT